MLAQLVVNGVVAGSSYILLALSFGIIYGVTGTFHFAHGGIFSAAGYLFYQIADQWQVSVAIAAPIVIIVTCLMGVGCELYIYRPLRVIGASPMAVMLSSLGLFVVLQNIVIVFWGGLTLVAKAGGDDLRQALTLGSIWITPLQILAISVAILCWIGMEWLLKATRTGKAVRALAADSEMTELVGIGGERMRIIVFALGSGIVGVAGILAVVDTGLQPSAGMSALLIAVIAVIVGGSGSMTGAAIGALVIALAQNLGIWKLPSEWQQAIAFSILIVFIFCRPTGLFAARRAS